MRILTRYVVREHVGPLVFALTALTSLLMLQYVARQLANLAGKGLPWSAIGKFFVLSLPFTVAMTMPMAVLVATLYAFGRMAAEHEITAFKANGVRVRTLMTPVLVAAFLLSVVMVVFNDQVLPRANHTLRVLQQDIARTKPALALREQVLNTITEQFVMKVARSDAGTGKIHDVVIFDLSRPLERKTIYADSGRISLAPNGRDLQLELWDGHVQELVKGDGRRLQRTFFRSQNTRLRGVSQQFELTGTDGYKGDREMSICELHSRYMTAGREYAKLRDDYLSFADKKEVAGQVVRTVRSRPAQQSIATAYCGALASVTSLFNVKGAEAAPIQQRAPSVSSPPSSSFAVPADSTFIASAFMATTTQLVEARNTLDQVAVEIHKKFALSFACLVFVLFGPPIALRFPRGGVGTTIGVSIVVFGLYYVCLMGGEALADNGKLPPFIAMWIANITFGALGVALLWHVERTTDTSRGGGLRDWWADRRALRKMRKAERAQRKRMATATPAGAA